MEEISPRTIQYGLNRRTNEKHTIENAIDGDVYTCLQCGNRLSLRRHGTVYVPYFAHWWGTSYVKGSCIYGSAEEQQESIRLCEYAIDSNTFRIRLFIEKRPHSSELVLYGSIPTLNLKDLKLVMQDPQQIMIESAGTRRQVSKDDLLPYSEGGVIELDPSAQSYTINISPQVSIAGRWWADGLKPNDFFIGDEFHGEFFKEPHYLASDESVYIISPTFITDLPNEAEKLRLGPFEVVRLDVNRDVLQVLKLSGRELFLDDNPIRVDVIRPFTTNPRAQLLGYVQGLPGSEALIAIIPPPNLDPEFKLIPLPSFEGEEVTLPTTGVGSPRFFRASLDKMQSKRLLIYLPGKKHRNILLDFSIIPPTEEYEAISSAEFGVEMRTVKSVHKALATLSQKLELFISAEEPILPSLKLLCPKRFRVKLEAEHPDITGPIWRDEGVVGPEDFQSRVYSILQTGARTLKIQFRKMGTVEIYCDFYYIQVLREQTLRHEKEKAEREQERHKRRKKSLDEHLRDLDQLPKSVYRPFVEKLLKSAEVVDYSELEFSKWRRMIRRKIRALRKQRKKQRVRSRNLGFSPINSLEVF